MRGVPGAASMALYYEAIATMSLSDAVRYVPCSQGAAACGLPPGGHRSLSNKSHVRQGGGVACLYSNPALCAVIAWVLGTEAVTAVAVAGVAATVAGVVFIAQPPFLFGQTAWDQTRLLGAPGASPPAVRACLVWLPGLACHSESATGTGAGRRSQACVARASCVRSC